MFGTDEETRTPNELALAWVWARCVFIPPHRHCVGAGSGERSRVCCLEGS